jgi:hypothetical protein
MTNSDTAEDTTGNSDQLWSGEMGQAVPIYRVWIPQTRHKFSGEFDQVNCGRAEELAAD